MAGIRRREVLRAIGGATVAWPLAARAQEASRPLVGILLGSTPVSASPLLKSFALQMQTLGHVERQDYDTAVRFAEGDLTRMPALASELVALNPAVIVTANSTAATAVKNATSSIPIVSAAMIEPVERGLVASHARPAGNLTGILISLDTLLGKQLQIATELLARAKKVGMPINVSSVSSAVQRRDAEKVASDLHVELVAVDVRTKDDIDAALRRLVNDGVDVAIVPTDPLFFSERQRMAALADALRLPAVYGLRDHTEVGGLMSYGIDLLANWRRAADFADKLLKGKTPAELPVELPSKLELVINLKTAKALGLDMPATLLARADEVIE